MGLPLSLLFLSAISFYFYGVLPLAGCLAAGVLFWLLAGYFTKLPEKRAEECPPPFTRGQKLLLITLCLCSIFYVHAMQMLHTPGDFIQNYPLTRIMAKDAGLQQHPLLPWIELKGRFAIQKLTAMLSQAEGGDTLRTQWLCGIALVVNGIFLWAAAIRKISGSPAAGTLGALLLFAGVNVGGKAGMIDAFGFGEALTASLMGVMLSLFADIICKARGHWQLQTGKILLTALAAGLYGLLCETYLLLLIGCFVSGCLIIGRRRRSAAGQLLKACFICTAGSLCLSALCGGFLGRAALSMLTQPADLYAPPAGTQASLQQFYAETSEFSFPKKNFLSIRLGTDPYTRLSGALNTAWFRAYRPALDEVGYSSIFGSKVLIMHWLPTWLAPLTLFWAVYRRSVCGYMFGILGILAYLIPGLADFGPSMESAYFRWEFAAGAGFAGLLGTAAADVLEHIPAIESRILRVSAHTAFIVFIVVNIIAAQRQFNNIIIEAQRSSQAAAKVLRPWYPKTSRWLLSRPDLALNPRDIELAKWIWDSSSAPQIIWREQNMRDIAQASKCAAFNGLAGSLSCEHAVPSAWQPAGVPPYLPNEATSAFLKVRNPELIAGLGAKVLITETPLEEKYLHDYGGLSFRQERVFGNSRKYIVYSVNGALPCRTVPAAAAGAVNTETVKTSGIPAPGRWISGCAYPVTVSLSAPFHGWLRAAFIPRGSAPLTASSPGSVTVRAEGKTIKTSVTPPLNEGEYFLQWLASSDGKTWQRLPGLAPASYKLSENIEENLRVKSVISTNASSGLITLKNIGASDFDCGGPLLIKWFVWSEESHNYRQASIPEGQTEFSGTIPPHGEAAVKWQTAAPLTPGCRLDVSAGAWSTQNISISRY